jgi:pyrroline-5-carboxylate reductase
MAQALAGSMRRGELLAGVRVYDPAPDQINRLRQRLGPGLEPQVCGSGADAATGVDACFLAVKPQMLVPATADLQRSTALFASILAGVPLAALRRRLPAARLVRVMPNTPCLVGAMAAGYAFAADSTAADRQLIAQLLAAAGVAEEVAEADLDAITALSGSGPAFFARLIEWYAAAGEAEGLSPRVALTLTLQTALGTAALLQELAMSPAELVAMVSSPGGTTVAGREQLEGGGVATLLRATLRAATQRSRELGAEQMQAETETETTAGDSV